MGVGAAPQRARGGVMGSFTEGVCIESFRDTTSRSSEVWACVGRPGRTAAANVPGANVNSQSERLLRATWHHK